MKELTPVLRLLISSSLHENRTSKIPYEESGYYVALSSRFIEVFLVLVS